MKGLENLDTTLSPAHPDVVALRRALGTCLLSRGAFSDAKRLLVVARDYDARLNGGKPSVDLLLDLGLANEVCR